MHCQSWKCNSLDTVNLIWSYIMTVCLSFIVRHSSLSTISLNNIS
jgi:hypothetical protein